MNTEAVHATLDALCRKAGACAWGVAEAGPVDAADKELYGRWLARGMHGPMDYMARHADLRSDPRLLLEGARSVLVCVFSIRQPRRSGCIADFALGSDYHEVLRARLRPVAEAVGSMFGGTIRICVDSAPLRERYWAVRAGLGETGLNGRLIVRGVGSDVLLAEILTSAVLPPTVPENRTPLCDGCGACVRACPSGALDGTGAVDARRCIACLTIEHRGPLPDGASLHGSLVGCDICGRVCPANTRMSCPEPLAELLPREEVLALTPARAAALSAGEFSEIFRRSAVKRLKAEGLRRNALYIINEKEIKQDI